MAMRNTWAANVTITRTAFLIGLTAILTSCDPVSAGGGANMAASTKHNWKDLWRGSGPPRSPNGAPPGLTVVHSKTAWTRIITPYHPSQPDVANPKVDWSNEVLLSIQAVIDNPDSLVEIQSFTSDGKTVTIAATLRPDPTKQVSQEVEVRPWLLASTPAAAIRAAAVIKFTLNGSEHPVFQEK